MKTSVNMVRMLDKYKIIQRTKDGYFDSNILLSEWNKNNKFIRRRKISEFLEASKTKEFINEILTQESESRKIDKPINQVVTTQKGKTSKSGKKELDKVWMHPYLFIDFAMWINPAFKYKVIQFVYDQLINFRNNAGDNYKGLTESIAIFEPTSIQYMHLAKALNYIVFGKHEKGLRQVATQTQLSKLSEIQKKLSFAVDMGYICTFDELLNEMRRIYYALCR